MDNKQKYEGADRRKHFRLTYLKEGRPTLKVEKHNFEVLDISQRGLRFLNDKAIRLPKYVSGKLIFTDGESIDIEGLLKWEHDDYFGVYLKDLLSPAILQKEQRYVQEQTT